MEKRLLIALSLSFLILVGWSVLFPPEPIERPEGGSMEGSGTQAEQGEAAFERRPGDVPAVVEPAGASEPPVGEVLVDDEERTLELFVGPRGQKGSFRAVFSNRGACLRDLDLGNYVDVAGLTPAERMDPAHWVELLDSIETPFGSTASMVLRTNRSSEDLVREPLEQALWRMEVLGDAEDPDGVEFELAPGTGVVFRKRFLFDPAGYGIRLELELVNAGAEVPPGPRLFLFTPAACVPPSSGDTWYREPRAVAASGTRSDVDLEVVLPRTDGGDLQGRIPVDTLDRRMLFAGVTNKYFCVLLSPGDLPEQRTLVDADYRRLRDEGWARANPGDADEAWRQVVCDVHLELDLPPAGGSVTYVYDVYAGPKQSTELAAADPAFQAVIDEDLGWFSGIANLLVAVLVLLEGATGNWGVAIILLTLLVRAALFPLNRRQQTAMARYQKKMQRLKPRIDEIKERWKKDLQRQRQEQAKLMQQEGAMPPLGGCLPMFLQIPIFIGLFRALGNHFELRQAPFFGWIQDLSLPDRLMRIDLNTHLPFIGTIEYLNVLPPLMVLMWVWQVSGQPAPADEQAARMQKMMKWMPVMMGFFLYNYAAGLSLYMITTSTFGLIEQKVIKKYWPVDDTEQPAKKSGFMARLAKMQEEQMKRAEELKGQRSRGGGPKKARSGRR